MSHVIMVTTTGMKPGWTFVGFGLLLLSTPTRAQRKRDAEILLDICTLNPAASICANWTAGDAAGASMCDWEGVTCGPITGQCGDAAESPNCGNNANAPWTADNCWGQHTAESPNFNPRISETAFCYPNSWTTCTNTTKLRANRGAINDGLGECSGPFDPRDESPRDECCFEECKKWPEIRPCRDCVGADPLRVSALDLNGQGVSILPPEFGLLELCYLDITCSTVAELPQIDQHATLTWIKGVNTAHTLNQFGLPRSARSEICPVGYFFAVPFCKLCPCTPWFHMVATCAGDQRRICDPAGGMGTLIVKGLIALALVSGFLHALRLMTGYEWPDDDVDAEEATQAEKVKEAAESMAVLQDLSSAVRDTTSNVQVMATHFKIVWLQLQMCFAALANDWSWPTLLAINLRGWLAWIQVDIAGSVPLACLDGGGEGASRQVRMLFAAVVFFVSLAMLIVRARANPKRAAHITNFFWAIYMLLGPMIWNMTIMLAVVEKGHNGRDPHVFPAWMWGVLLPPFVIIGIIVPCCACFKLRKAMKAGALQTPKIQASFGWLCAHYVANCYWWEIVTLLCRMLTMGGLLFPPSVSLAIYMVMTTTMLTLQLYFKPFLESKAEAAHWSSPNKQAALGYSASLTFMTVGFLSQASEFDSDGFAPGVLSFVAVVAVLTPLTMAVIIAGQTYGCLSGGPNRDGAKSDVETNSAAGADMDVVDNPVSKEDGKSNAEKNKDDKEEEEEPEPRK